MRTAEKKQQPEAKFDWAGFVIRFVCGALLGVFVFFCVIPSIMRYRADHFVSLIVFAVTVLGCGLLSAFFGDEFWERFLGLWWWGR